MTSLSENDHKNEINIDSKQCAIENEHSSLNNNDSLLVPTTIQKSSHSDQKQEELNEKGQSNDLTSELQKTNINNEINNNDALVNTSPSIVTTDEEQKQQPKEATETTVNHDENGNGSRKLFNSKVKYSSMPYHRSPYYTNGHPYGPAPYYYYPISPSLIEKPTPLMFIPTLHSSSSSQISSSTSPSSSRDNQSGNSTTISPQNLPPRLRQASTTENESNLQASSTTSQSTPQSSTITNGRRHHRSILSRGSANYHFSHLPPPLMATPPGVLYTYPPIVHQPGHIAYNIRPVDEFEYLAYQQQMMNLPATPLLWAPPPPPPMTSHGYPYFSPYSMNGSSSTYMVNNTIMTQSTNSFLNPEAAEWVPSQNDNESSSSDNHILINDETHFPPLNSTTTNNTQTIPNVNDHIEDNSEQIDTASEVPSTNNNNDNANDNSQIQTDSSNVLSSQLNSKIESTNTSSSSQDNNNKPLSSSPVKVTPLAYSTIISQTSENNKSIKINTNTQQQPQQRRQPQQQLTNHINNQLPPRDRTTKQQQQQRTQNTASSSSSSNTNSHRRQSFNNNRNNNRGFLSSETNSLPKQQPQQQQQQINDDWIEVKSKKTKKFDRIITDNSSEKLILDEPIHKSVSPPLSLTSTGENTTTTFTSEDDFDEKDNNDLVIIMDNHITNDYNQIIVDDIHRRLDNNERLLIIMRGCPGSGKSTLAKSINHGYNGLILSADDYFNDNALNKYIFDSNKLDEAHRFTGRRASDALKRNISPIIIDNTNTQTWEMKPYVAMGKEAGYDILLVEPQTPWRYKARELLKRNVHNLPLRRIKEMINRFEHNITVQSIINQIPSMGIKNNLTSTEQQNLNKNNELIDPLCTSKKFYDIIDDSLILDDVRLCINDMILFLTSNFYQTTLLSSTSILTTTTTTTATTTSQPSTPLSVSFHDLSLISSSTTTSLPSTPSTPHARFHRPLTRYSSATNQDHSFNTEHILRLPTSTFSRCIDTTNLTAPLSAQSNIVGKKRRKNKNKQQSNEILLNVNNNNNNMENEEENLQQQQQQHQQKQSFDVILPEECSDFVVIDEKNDNDWINNVNRNFGIQINSLKDHSSTLSHKQKQLTNPKNCELLNIIHNELNKPSHNLPIATGHVAIQCSPNDFNCQINHSDRILIGHLSSPSTLSITTSSLSPLPGCNECGIQVDLIDNNIDVLIDIYSNRLSSETIRQFYEVCHSDLQWTQTHIDEYLQHNNVEQTYIPTLRQLCLNVLNEWNEHIKSTNPLANTESIDDLLQDINDDEIFEELTLTNNNIEFIDTNEICIPAITINSLEELYGELPNKSTVSSNNDSILLPLDDELSISIYQAVQRFLIKSNQTSKPVIENQIKKENTKKKKNHSQQWKLPSENQLNSNINTDHIPSFRQIMNEEQQAAKSQKSTQKQQLDYATEHKLKELEHHFPTLDSDLLYDIFRENEFNYEITLVCISTMFDENASITTIQKSPSIPSSNSISTTKTTVEPILDSYETLRRDAFYHAQQRKEFYTKAHQANHHGMSGVASFYIHRACEETQLMKDANRAACEHLSRWRLEQYHQTQRLDLHDLHLNEALNLFKQIEHEFNEGNRRTTPKSIEIITGYGKNSIYGGGGYGKIRSAILAYLQQRNYKYSEPNKGVILLQLTNVRN